jgi:hypothetical protein
MQRESVEGRRQQIGTQARRRPDEQWNELIEDDLDLARLLDGLLHGEACRDFTDLPGAVRR